MKDLYSAPKWLTYEYIETFLKKYKKDNTLRILELDIQPATAKGENYASVMTRIKVDFTLNKDAEHDQGSYIVKTSHENNAVITNIMNKYNPYKTEMMMYEKILPQLPDILKEIDDHEKISPETIHVDYEHSAIIFEDLKISNFETLDRVAGLTVCQSKLALKKLAKFHATTAVLNERTPGVLTKFDRGIFNRHTRGFASFFESICVVCANFAGECPELGEYYKIKLLKLRDHFVENAENAFYPNSDHFYTLTHGDFWTNNLMVRYNENELNSKSIEDLLLIDFQFCSWSTPATDLHYLFHTSLRADKRLSHIDILVQYYHKELSQTLRALKFGGYIPTLHELHVQFEVAGFYAVSSGLGPQSVMINDQCEDADIDALLGNSERSHRFHKTLYENKVLQEYMKTWLPIFDRKGLLDVDC